MVDNPQLLVPTVRPSAGATRTNLRADLDAIYLPFKEPAADLHEGINSLCQFSTVYLLPSPDCAVERGSENTEVLNAHEPQFERFFCDLLTSRHRLTACNCATWDLPMKRTYALRHAVESGYKKILFIDDDILLGNAELLLLGVECLNRYSIAGCFVEEFLDTSIVGHLERRAGDDVYSFLSGSFLFVDATTVHGFFPSIYNEDWLFMLPHILNGSACSFGAVRQRPFDPFTDLERASFQEFGDVIAEGLYWLVQSGEYGRRFDMDLWRYVLSERRAVLNMLRDRLKHQKFRRIIAKSLFAHNKITPQDCQRFVRDWEIDMSIWGNH